VSLRGVWGQKFLGLISTQNNMAKYTYAAKVSLAEFNGTGVSASVEEKDGFKSICLFEDEEEDDPRVACFRSASELRRLADLFDRLAEEKDPFKDTVQKKLNRKKKE
jgi:hypothetical protein